MNQYMFLLSASGDANNAFNDILNNTRWQGNMDTISPIVGIIDVGFTTYLTIIAFFIIMAAMSRNILAAGYCAFPKFFDQVHEAHMEVADQSWFNRFGTVDGWKSRFQEMNMSTIKKFFMRLVPDIKVLTDFEEGVYDFKSYFIRAIPQMLAVVCLGAFIYNGFYRDVASQVTNFGSEMFRRVILNTDPVTFIDRITNSAGRPDFAYSEDKTTKGKLINSISQKSYSMIMSKYKDLTGRNTKQSIASAIETSVEKSINSNKVSKKITDFSKYKISYDVKWSVGDTPYKSKPYESEDGNKITFALNSISMKKLGFESTYEVGVNWQLTPIVTFKKSFDLGQAVDNLTPSNSAILTLRYDAINSLYQASEKRYAVKLLDDLKSLNVDTTSVIKTEYGTEIEIADGYLYIKKAGFTELKDLDIATGLYYDDPGKNVTHTIAKLKFDASATESKISDGKTAVTLGQSLQEARIKKNESKGK